MKKFLIMLLVIIILTGCREKNINCEINIKEKNISSNVFVNGIFDNDKLIKQSIKIIFDLSEYLEYADIDTYYENFKNEYSSYDNVEGILLDISKNDNNIIINIQIDLEKIDPETYKKLDFGNGNVIVSSKLFEKEIVDMGFICKNE